MRPTINLYQRPVQGNNFLSRHVALNYRHRISANGWYDTATCDIVPDADQYNVLIDDYIGARVAVFGSNPLQPIWEGIINRISYVQNGVSFSNSLDSMYNAVYVQYDASTGVTYTAAASTNATSIAKYGRKGAVINVGNHSGTTSLAEVQSTLSTANAYPQKSMVASPGQANSPLRIEMIGFYQTLGWAIATNNSAVAIALDSALRGLVSVTNTQSNVWYNNTASDYGAIIANAVTIAPASFYTLTVLEAIRKIVEAGDGGNRWIFGIEPTDVNLRTRRLYYRQSSYTIRYTARVRDGLRIRDLYGRLVDPATVRPDCGIRITDLTTLWNGIGDNPSETYIDSVDYDANSGRVTLVSADDPRVEGLFQIARYGKPRHGRFNQQPRGF
jgi:hypothetical protein